MRRSFSVVLSCLAVGSVIALAGGCSAGKCAGCGDGRECGSTAACKAVKPGVITTANKMCVIMNEDPVDPSVKAVVWRGQEYGLCCEGCRPKWEKLSDAQKGAAVARVVAVAH